MVDAVIYFVLMETFLIFQKMVFLKIESIFRPNRDAD